MRISLLLFCMLLVGPVFSQGGGTFKFGRDTLRINGRNCSDLKRDSFYRYKRLYISSRYKLIDSVELGKAKGVKVLVFSPLNQEEFEYTFPCYLLIRRILMIYNDYAKSDPVSYLTDNVVLNRYDWQSDPYLYGETLKRTDSGFSLSFTAGSKIKCDLNLYFAVKQKRIYLNEYDAMYYSNASPRAKENEYKLPISSKYELDKLKTKHLFKFPNW